MHDTSQEPKFPSELKIAAVEAMRRIGGKIKLDQLIDSLAKEFRSKAKEKGMSPGNIRKLRDGADTLPMVGELLSVVHGGELRITDDLAQLFLSDDFRKGATAVDPKPVRIKLPKKQRDQEVSLATTEDVLSAAVRILYAERQNMLGRKREGHATLDEIAKPQAESDVDRRSVEALAKFFNSARRAFDKVNNPAATIT